MCRFRDKLKQLDHNTNHNSILYTITKNRINELFVDQSNGHEKIDVRLNVSLPRLNCKYAGLDIQDESGRHEVGALDNMIKAPLDNGVGCRIEVVFQINKVPGNFHLSTHSSSQQPSSIDMAHEIHEISFGDDVKYLNLHGSFDPLGKIKKLDASGKKSASCLMINSSFFQLAPIIQNTNVLQLMFFVSMNL